jgi:hypothetical protein
LPSSCSEEFYQLVGQPKELVLYDEDNQGVTNHRYPATEKIKDFAFQNLRFPSI